MFKTPVALILTLAIGAAMLTQPSPASAQNIGVSPSTLDFGALEIGTVDFLNARISSLGPTPLTLESITIENNPSNAFSLDAMLLNGIGDIAAIPPALTLPAGDFLDLTVIFSPDVVGALVASVAIRSNAVPPDNDLTLPLIGMGISATAIPAPSTIALVLLGVVGVRYSRPRAHRLM